MAVNFQLLLREGVLFALLFALGSGLAARLPDDGAGSRLALAPAFGLAAGAVVLITLSWFVTLRHAFWLVVVPVAAVSLGTAWLELRSQGGLRAAIPPPRQLAGLVLVAALAGALFSYPLAKRDSLGPMGYGIFDGPGYVTYIDGYGRFVNDTPAFDILELGSISERSLDGQSWGQPWDMAARYGWAYHWQHTSSDSIPAAVSPALGWEAWSVLAPFMVVLIIAGALATFALARAFSERTWAGGLAGALYAGPALLQIFMDGSQGLLAGLALIPALLACGLLALQQASWRATLAFGLLMAGLQAIYPELLPVAGASIAGILVLRAAAELWAGRSARVIIGAAGPHVAAIVALTWLGSPRTAYWAAEYLRTQLASRGIGTLLVPYQMRVEYLFGWLAQTREFYAFAFSRPEGAGQVFWGGVVPFLLVAAAVVGVAAYRRAWPLLVVAAVICAQAWAASRSLDCGYCIQRSLLILAPVIPVLIALGLVALARLDVWPGPRLPGRAHAIGPPGGGSVLGALAAAALALLLAVGVGTTMADSEDRAVAGAFMVSSDLPAMLEDVERLPGRGPIALEGLNSVPVWAWAELPATYAAVQQRTRRRLSIPAEHNDWGGLSYWATRPRGDPVYTPGYDWVLTRLGALNSGRQVLARHGPLALERRTRPFDVMVERGVAADTYRRDRSGSAWVQPPGNQLGLEQGPLTFWVAAQTRQRAWLRIELEGGPPEMRIEAAGAMRQGRGPAGRLTACVPVPGTGARRVATATVTPSLPPLGPPAGPLEVNPQPARSVRLAAVRAVADCRL